MQTIKENITHEITINKSRFITEIMKVKRVEEVKEQLDYMRKKYVGATHYCYAYIINQDKKSSDDGEPGGTAGVVMMEILQKKELNYVLVVVIRYFGGIKLGAGGLVRAYSRAVREALENKEFSKIISGYKVNITIPYTKQKELEYLLKKIEYQKKYDEEVTYTIYAEEEIINILNKTYDISCLESIELEK